MRERAHQQPFHARVQPGSRETARSNMASASEYLRVPELINPLSDVAPPPVLPYITLS